MCTAICLGDIPLGHVHEQTAYKLQQIQGKKLKSTYYHVQVSFLQYKLLHRYSHTHTLGQQNILTFNLHPHGDKLCHDNVFFFFIPPSVVAHAASFNMFGSNHMCMGDTQFRSLMSQAPA